MLLSKISVAADVAHLDVILEIFLRQEEALQVIPRLRFSMSIIEAECYTDSTFIDLGLAFPTL